MPGLAFLGGVGALRRDRLVQARKKLGLRQRDLAAKIDVRPNTVAEWEQGLIAMPSADNLAAAASTLGVTVAWLLGDDAPAPARTEHGDPPGWPDFVETADYLEADKAHRDALRGIALAAATSGFTPTRSAYSAWLVGLRMCGRLPTTR